MAWEWVAPVATFATGATGIWFTYRTSRNQSKSSLDALLKQLRESHESELRKEKRQLYADYLGALAEASFITLTMQVAHSNTKFEWGKLPASTQKAVLRSVNKLFPENMSPDERAKMIVKALDEAKPKVEEAMKDRLAEKGVPRYPLAAINFKDLWRLAAQVDMVGGKEIAILTREPITSIAHVLAAEGLNPEEIQEEVLKIEVQILLLRSAMRDDLQYAPNTGSTPGPRKRWRVRRNANPSQLEQPS
ncbi:hypothetical protein [Amycolatopsis sp. NPDC003731]